MTNSPQGIDFIGVGAQKAGTSWLYANLYEHPEICAPIKELHFFSRPRFEKGREWYESHFRFCKQSSKKGEFSTSYLYSKEAPKRIHSLYPEAKLIAVLRHPVNRAYSQYQNAIKAGEIGEFMSFEEYATKEPSVYEQGLYAKQLEHYFVHFKREQILVLIYEDIEKDPAAFMRRVYEFIGVNAKFTPTMLHRRVNIARMPRLVFLERVMHKLAENLRRSGLDRLVWLVRLSRLPDLLRFLNTKTGQAADTAPDVSSYLKVWREDAAKLSDLLGRDMLKEWEL